MRAGTGAEEREGRPHRHPGPTPQRRTARPRSQERKLRERDLRKGLDPFKKLARKCACGDLGLVIHKVVATHVISVCGNPGAAAVFWNEIKI